MRHLGSVVLSLLLAAVIYALTGIGLVRMGNVYIHSGASKSGAMAVALGALLGAGILYSVLILSRLSPLGPALAGLAFFSITMWAILSISSFQRTMPRSVLGVDQAGHFPVGGAAALLAVPLIATVVSPRRWRRYANANANAGAAVAPAHSTAAPSYASGYPANAAPSYGPPYYGTEPSATSPAPPAYPAERSSYSDPEATRRLNP
jgi:multisubunit Na+/H+ antiporter MnhG subunit